MQNCDLGQLGFDANPAVSTYPEHFVTDCLAVGSKGDPGVFSTEYFINVLLIVY